METIVIIIGLTILLALAALAIGIWRKPANGVAVSDDKDEFAKLQMDNAALVASLSNAKQRETEQKAITEALKKELKYEHEKAIAQLEGRYLAQLAEAKKEKETELKVAEDRHNKLITDAREAKNAELKAAEERFNKTIAELKAERTQELKQQDERLKTEFENAANRIFKQQSEDFSAASKTQLGEILQPLTQNIEGFKKQVKEAYDTEVRDKASLSEQIKMLTQLNQQMSTDASNLTKAIKGDVKAQGGWGELMLEKVLEASGLQKDINYTREEVVTGMDDEIYRPDVIVHLPDDKHIIIDSKVSLVSYERMVNAETVDIFENNQKEHVRSVKAHIDGLSKKEYHNAKGLYSPDFVLLFMPIEGAFSAALQADMELYDYAWKKKIVIVSPTTLLATLSTVASIWQNENQKKNALEIARLGGALYDKLVGMVDDLEKVNKSIGATQKAYNDAMNKMKDGKGNVFNTANKMKELGVKTQKQLPIGDE